ncbi:MAG: hypothetical protein M3044_02940 [Thermoproteota archaeon]|nr:hypothetical protein [Thermoproteota archaeon]
MKVGNPNKTDDVAIVTINTIIIPLQTVEANASENMEKLSSRNIKRLLEKWFNSTPSFVTGTLL